MADITFDGLDPIVEQKTTDIYAISANGSGSYKETRQQMIDYLLQLFAPNFTAANTVYVDPAGSNSDPGTQSEPFADPFFAMSAITGTLANPKNIQINTGTYATTNSTIKPNVSLIGNGYHTRLNNSGTITLDPTWSSAAGGSISTINNLRWDGNFNLDFVAAEFSTGGLLFNNPYLTSLSVTGGLVLNIEGGAITVLNLTSAEGIFSGVQIGANITIASGSPTGNKINEFIACNFSESTAITVSGASGKTQELIIKSSPIRGSLTIDGTFVTVRIDAASIPQNGITFINGATDAQVNRIGNAPAVSLNNTFTGQNGIAPIAITSSGGSVAWNLNTAPNAIHVLTENTTIAAPTNPIDGFTYELMVVQDASSARTLGFNAKFKFPGNVTPVISTTLSSRSRFTAKYYAALDIYDTDYSLDYRT